MWQRMSEDQLTEGKTGLCALCSIRTLSCRRCRSSEGFEQGDARAVLSFTCIDLAAESGVRYLMGTRLEID